MAAVLGRVRDSGKSIFVVTHQAALMETVADEFVQMAGGQIVSREQPGSNTPVANPAARTAR
jgi:ABC-type polar amino acid transport system ATPase subunit